MEYKNLSAYGHSIAQAPDLETAKSTFVDMVNNFNFKGKREQFIREARDFTGNKVRFVKWAWDIILSSEGLKVL